MKRAIVLFISGFIIVAVVWYLSTSEDNPTVMYQLYIYEVVEYPSEEVKNTQGIITLFDNGLMIVCDNDGFITKRYEIKGDSLFIGEVCMDLPLFPSALIEETDSTMNMKSALDYVKTFKLNSPVKQFCICE